MGSSLVLVRVGRMRCPCHPLRGCLSPAWISKGTGGYGGGTVRSLPYHPHARVPGLVHGKLQGMGGIK